MLATLPWDIASDLPWHVLTSPLEKWATQPTFVVGEYTFIACALMCLWHAKRNGRAYLICWLAALIAGTANDLIFMALPLADTFWHGQATVMLTPRLPLYIPCVYVCFMYLPTTAVWRLDLRPLPAAALTGLLAILFYAPYDIIGAKYLWWTWHDSDLTLSHRLLGVPVGSTIWVITFAATFAWLLRRWGLIAVTLLTTVLMVLQMTALQQVDGGVPGPIGLVVVALLYGAVAVHGLRTATPQPRAASDLPILGALVIYFVTLLSLVTFDPATHQSASLHQTYGPCHVEATDITGLTRHAYVCADDYDEDWTFDCTAGQPPEMTEWYTVCGRPHSDQGLWMAGVGGLGAFGLAAFGLVLGFRRRRVRLAAAPPGRP